MAYMHTTRLLPSGSLVYEYKFVTGTRCAIPTKQMTTFIRFSPHHISNDQEKTCKMDKKLVKELDIGMANITWSNG